MIKHVSWNKLEMHWSSFVLTHTLLAFLRFHCFQTEFVLIKFVWFSKKMQWQNFCFCNVSGSLPKIKLHKKILSFNMSKSSIDFLDLFNSSCWTKSSTSNIVLFSYCKLVLLESRLRDYILSVFCTTYWSLASTYPTSLTVTVFVWNPKFSNAEL